MALPNITLAQFNAISNGSYNAGQIDFGTGRNGEAELVNAKITASAHFELNPHPAFVNDNNIITT